MSRPSSRIEPLLGSVKPPIMRRMVVLPEPEGPRMVMNSPSRTARSMFSSTLFGPKDFLTALSSRRNGSVAMLGCLTWLFKMKPGLPVLAGRAKRQLNLLCGFDLVPFIGPLGRIFDELEIDQLVVL